MSDYLPAEVILEILQRLPVKSLVRFRSVCKTWNTLISHPSFISTHLQTSLSNNTPFLLLKCKKKRKRNYFLHHDNDGFDEFKPLQFPVFCSVLDTQVLGSCHGLICLDVFPNGFLFFIFWNPSIHKYISLPWPSISHDVRLNFGFGFDSRTNDYKLVIVGVEKDGTWIQPYLFSLNENCWKRVNAVPPNYAFVSVFGIPLPFVNGAVHWLGYQKRNNGGHSRAILGFNLSAEEFLVIGLPESLIGLNRSRLSAMNGESSIAVLRKNGEVLLHVAKGEMASLNLNCQQLEPHGVVVGDSLNSVDGSYVESLVLLDKGVNVPNMSYKF
ncbi:hypothetical protein GQ457_02G032570 [Hibiscus cannabinus]